MVGRGPSPTRRSPTSSTSATNATDTRPAMSWWMRLTGDVFCASRGEASSLSSGGRDRLVRPPPWDERRARGRLRPERVGEESSDQRDRPEQEEIEGTQDDVPHHLAEPVQEEENLLARLARSQHRPLQAPTAGTGKQTPRTRARGEHCSPRLNAFSTRGPDFVGKLRSETTDAMTRRAKPGGVRNLSALLREIC